MVHYLDQCYVSTPPSFNTQSYLHNVPNAIEEIDSSLDNTKEWISELDHRVVEIIKIEQKKKKKVFKLRIVQEMSGATSSILASTL